MRTADQTDQARFWAEGPQPWTRAARQLAADRGLRRSETARMFAMLYMTGADTAISHLERQGALAVLAPDHRHPRGRGRRQPRTRRPTPRGCR